MNIWYISLLIRPHEICSNERNARPIQIIEALGLHKFLEPESLTPD